MKKYLFAVVLAASTMAHAQISIGDLIKIGSKLASGKVNCNATYLVSDSGVFGHETSTQLVNIKGKNAGDACVKAQSMSSQGSGVFGPNSRVLRSLQCTNVTGRSFFVDINTCQPIK